MHHPLNQIDYLCQTGAITALRIKSKTLYLPSMENEVAEPSVVNALFDVGKVILVFAVGFIFGMITALIWVKRKMNSAKR